jgi:hypothetical protein
MLDGEALALMGLGFRRIYFLELWCPSDGAIRVAIEYQPSNRYDCPLCNRSCACGYLAQGFTRRQTPFWEIHCTAPRLWPSDKDNDIHRPQPKARRRALAVAADANRAQPGDPRVAAQRAYYRRNYSSVFNRRTNEVRPELAKSPDASLPKPELESSNNATPTLAGSKLSEKDYEIIKFVALGWRNRTIAVVLKTTEQVVKK